MKDDSIRLTHEDPSFIRRHVAGIDESRCIMLEATAGRLNHDEVNDAGTSEAGNRITSYHVEVNDAGNRIESLGITTNHIRTYHGITEANDAGIDETSVDTAICSAFESESCTKTRQTIAGNPSQGERNPNHGAGYPKQDEMIPKHIRYLSNDSEMIPQAGRSRSK